MLRSGIFPYVCCRVVFVSYDERRVSVSILWVTDGCWDLVSYLTSYSLILYLFWQAPVHFENLAVSSGNRTAVSYSPTGTFSKLLVQDGQSATENKGNHSHQHVLPPSNLQVFTGDFKCMTHKWYKFFLLFHKLSLAFTIVNIMERPFHIAILLGPILFLFAIKYV